MPLMSAETDTDFQAPLYRDTGKCRPSRGRTDPQYQQKCKNAMRPAILAMDIYLVSILGLLGQFFCMPMTTATRAMSPLGRPAHCADCNCLYACTLPSPALSHRPSDSRCSAFHSARRPSKGFSVSMEQDQTASLTM
jgi:hypothetical protein